MHVWGVVQPQVCESRAISTMQKANNGTAINVSSADCSIVFLHKVAITDVILECDLNAVELIFA